MKKIYLNLKRFDVPPAFGGLNRLSAIERYGETVVQKTESGLAALHAQSTEFVQFFPEAHLLSALAALPEGSPLSIGCQGVHRRNITPGGNFGAFTSSRPAAAMAAMGVRHVLIGHCEERMALAEVLAEGGAYDAEAIDRLLSQEVRAALESGLSVLYCVGEKEDELSSWDEVILRQLRTGLGNADLSRITIAYEPVWSIGPGKTPADAPYITKVARLIKDALGPVPVVYGGGLKAENARMLAGISEIDGGLIALTRFQGEIGFYPEEYLEIIRLYLGVSAE